MKNKTYILNTLLAAVLGAVLLIAVLVRTFAPAVIIPSLDVPNLVLISLVALLLDYYVAAGAKRCNVCIVLLSVVTFGLLPWAAAFVAPAEAVKLAALGGAVFSVTTWLFDTMADRLSTGPNVKAAPVISALGLYLAAQILMGML